MIGDIFEVGNRPRCADQVFNCALLIYFTADDLNSS